MPSTFSPLKIQLMATGENNTTWGDVTNLNLGTALEEAIVGSADVTFASADVTLTLTDTNASQTARNMRLRCTGTTGGSTRNLIVPSIEKPYIVKNDCADSVVVKTAAGTGITVPAGKTTWVYSDATNVVDAVTHLASLTLSTPLPVSSGGTGVNTSLTAGSVVFAGASGAYSQDNANFFWDDTNNRLGIGTNTPLSALDVIGNIRIPSTNSLYWAGGNELINAVENNRMTFFVAGSERMRINASGNVGIGTSSPTTKLDVEGTSNTQVGIRTPYATAGSTASPIYQSVSFFGYAGTERARITGIDTASNNVNGQLAFWTGQAGTMVEAMRIDAIGNVGIGNLGQPVRGNLDISLGNISTAGVERSIHLGYSVSDFYGFKLVNINSPGSFGAGTFSIQRGTTAAWVDALLVNDSGNVGIGTSSPASKLEVAGTTTITNGLLDLSTGYSIRWGGAASGIYSGAGTADMVFTAGSSERMRVNGATGNVGIGTSSPTAKLQIGNVGTSFGASEVNLALTGANGFFNSSLLFASENTNVRYQNKFLVDTGALLWQNSTDGTNYTERMRIDSSGQVGIGTSNPISTLDVTGSSGITTTSGGNTARMLAAAGGAYFGSTTNTAVIFQTNSSERMRIDTSGNVGIGTSSPTTRLEVSGSFTTTANAFGVVTLGRYDAGFPWAIVRPDATATGIEFRNNAGDQVLSMVSSTKNVGIGTSAPTNRLSVSNAGAQGFEIDPVTGANGGISTLAFNRGTASWLSLTQYASDFRWDNGGTERMRIDSSGNVGIGTSSPARRLTVSAGAGASVLAIQDANTGNAATDGFQLQLASNGDMYLWNYENTITAFGTNNTERMRIDSSGNVGIGTSAPGYRLDVSSGATANTVNISSISLATYNPAAYNGASARVFMRGGNSVGTFTGTQFTHGGNFEAFFGAVQNASNTADFVFQGYSGSVYEERMRIDASGNVGIGTTGPLSRLDVREANRADSTNIANVGIYTTSAQSTGVGGTLALGGLFNGSDTAPFGSIRGGKQNSISGNYDGYLAFQTIANGGVLTENMRITAAGNVNISNGNLVIGTALKGIDFSADSHAAGMTSELLDDYEEGTFTPTLSSDGTPPTVTGYANRYGSYTKIGNRVYISVNIRATVTAVGTGTPQVTGFPYAANSNTLNGVSLGLTDLMTVPFNANYINGSTLILALGAYTVVTNGYLTFSAMYEI